MCVTSIRVNMKKIITSSLCVVVLSACNQKPESAPDSIYDAELKSKVELTTDQVSGTQSPKVSGVISGIDTANFDTAVRPQDDLYRYVNGSWLNRFEIPADKSNYGAFTKLADKSREDVKAIIEQAAKESAEKGSDIQKVGDLYRSFMDQEHLNKLGNTPLEEEFSKIERIQNLSDLSGYIALAQMVSGAPFYTGVGIDSKDPSAYITQMGQSGLGLPNRDFYLKDDEKSEKIRQQYEEHVGVMLGLSGIKDSDQQAKLIMALETQLAEKQWPKEKLRDPVARYNKQTVKDLKNNLSNIDWKRWSDVAMLESIEHVVVAQPDYLIAVNKLLKDVPLATWKSYFKWRYLTSMAAYLSSDIDQENFRFYSGVLNGVLEQEPRWKRGVSVINRTLGEVVGKVYVAKHFKPEAKEKMVELVENLRDAYREGIDELEWMSEETKLQAKDKLNKFDPKIGYPDKWKDYSMLSIEADDLFGNILRSKLVEERRDRERLDKPVDRYEWFMTPQTVNAYYNPVFNEIVFPAAILQPPFFNLDADPAVNYGAIGAVIGHEMGHGFDDKGSQYDGDGKLRNWWTEVDRTEFEKRTGKLVAQYDQYTVLDGVHLNGEFTQGENIGDLSGLTIAYKAYQNAKNGQSAPVIDGLTGDQRVFAGWAQVWARKFRDEALRRRIDTDPHAPSEFRANGTVRNMPEFHQAFELKPEDKMYLEPNERVKIW